jgi:hypothetical protein
MKTLLVVICAIVLFPALVFSQNPVYTRDPVTGQIYRHDPVNPYGSRVGEALSQGFAGPTFDYSDSQRRAIENEKVRQDLERQILENKILRKQLEQMERGR